METLTIEEFQSDFDNVLSRVENGESFLIKSEYGDAVLIPYGESGLTDDLVKIYTDHEEGC